MGEPTEFTRLSDWLNQRDTRSDMDFELKMGSCVIPDCGSHYFTPGIVGPFARIKGSNNLYFITAKHVITQRLVHSRTMEGSQVMLLMYGAGLTRRCGRVYVGGKRGSRAALVKISGDLVPTRENLMKGIGIHFAGISPVSFPHFDNRDSSNRAQVVVFGKQTRTATVKIVTDYATGRIYLYTNETRLFKPGEAGAAVFLVDKERLLHCVGICMGRIKGDKFQFVVVPIEVILSNLSHAIGRTVVLETLGYTRVSSASVYHGSPVDTG